MLKFIIPKVILVPFSPPNSGLWMAFTVLKRLIRYPLFTSLLSVSCNHHVSVNLRGQTITSGWYSSLVGWQRTNEGQAIMALYWKEREN